RKGLEISELEAALYGGQLRAHAAWADSDQFYGYLDFQEVNIAALLAGLDLPVFLQGTGDLEATWHTWGATLAAWRAALNTRIQAEIKEGAFIGFSVWEQVDAASDVLQQLFSGQVPTMPEAYDADAVTSFDNAQFDLQGKDGQLQFTDLAMTGPYYEIRLGQPAWMNLVNEQLDLCCCWISICMRKVQSRRQMKYSNQQRKNSRAHRRLRTKSAHRLSFLRTITAFHKRLSLYGLQALWRLQRCACNGLTCDTVLFKMLFKRVC